MNFSEDSKFTIGREINNNYSQNHWTGKIDNVQLYSAELSHSQVLDVYNVPEPDSGSINNFKISVVHLKIKN